MKCIVQEGKIFVDDGTGVLVERPDFAIGDDTGRAIAFARFVVKQGLMTDLPWTVIYLTCLPEDLEGEILWFDCDEDSNEWEDGRDGGDGCIMDHACGCDCDCDCDCEWDCDCECEQKWDCVREWEDDDIWDDRDNWDGVKRRAVIR